jgi:hypothetical protein
VPFLRKFYEIKYLMEKCLKEDVLAVKDYVADTGSWQV